MDWFEKLTGFREKSPEQVRAKLSVDGEFLLSSVNGAKYKHGSLETPSLGELRQRISEDGARKARFQAVIADVRKLHQAPENAGAFFQVASQFNLLEMVSPNVIPEMGVGIYENDPTQGPACAISAGASTIYRNYFVPVGGDVGQSAHNQIDCLKDLGERLGNEAGRLWRMSNGYALATESGLYEISNRLRSATDQEIDELRALIRIGIHWSTEVTSAGAGHVVSQAFCSALPIGYSTHSVDAWEPFARLVLEAAYEAVFCAAVLNSQNHGNEEVFLTLLGGGVFQNKIDWIIDAIERSARLFSGFGLSIYVVSHGAIPLHVSAMVDRLTRD